ncbi:MAG: hypothetical protein AAFQ27_14360, partial [Pseudomonadota bacterium]
PELLLAAPDGEADIEIAEGCVPDLAEKDPNHIRAYVEGEPGELRLDIPGKLRMRIANGSRITYSRYPGVEDRELRLFLLGSGMGALLMQRGHMVVHGNAIVLDAMDGAAICVGDSGAGKSTTAIAMMQRGFPILADDVCPITTDGLALSGMPRAKLWQSTADNLRIDTSSLEQLRADDAKFNLPLGSAHCPQGRKARAFFALVPEEVETVSVTPLSGTASFLALRNNIYRADYLRPLGLEAEYLKQVATLAAETPFFRISRPANGFDIDAVLDAIFEAAESVGAPR